MIGRSTSEVSSYENIFDNHDDMMFSSTMPFCRSLRGMDQDCFRHHLDVFADDGSELDALTQCLRGPPLQRLISPPPWSELLGIDWAAQPHAVSSACPAVLSDLGLQEVSDSHITHEHRWTASQITFHEQSQSNQQEQHQQMFIRHNKPQLQHSQMIQMCSSPILPPPTAVVVQSTSLSQRQLKVPHVGSSISAGPVLATLLRNALARSSATSVSVQPAPTPLHLQDPSTGSFASDASMFGLPRSSSGTSQFTGVGIQQSYQQQHAAHRIPPGQLKRQDCIISQVSSNQQQHADLGQRDECQDMWLHLLPGHHHSTAHPDSHTAHMSNRDCVPHHFPNPSHQPLRHSSPPRHHIPSAQPVQKLPTPCSSPARFLQAAQHASTAPCTSIPPDDTSQARCSNESTLTASLPRLRLGRAGATDQPRCLSAWDGSMHPAQAAATGSHPGGLQAGVVWGGAQQVQTQSTAPVAIVQDARDDLLPTIDETSPLSTFATSSGKPTLAPRTPKTPSSKGTNQANPCRGSPLARGTPRSARVGQGAASKPLVLSRSSFSHTSPRSKASSGLLDSGFLAGSKQFPWPPAPDAAGPPSRSTTPVLPISAVLGIPCLQSRKPDCNSLADEESPDMAPTTTLWEELIHIAQPLPACNMQAGAGVPCLADSDQLACNNNMAPPPRCSSANSDGNSNSRDIPSSDHQHDCSDLPLHSVPLPSAGGQWGQQQEWWSVSSGQDGSQRVQALDCEAASDAFAGEIEHWARAAVPNITPFLMSRQHITEETRRSIMLSRPLPPMPQGVTTLKSAVCASSCDHTPSMLDGTVMPGLAAPPGPVRNALGLENGSSSSLDTPALLAIRSPSVRASKRKFGNLGSLHGIEQAHKLTSPQDSMLDSASPHAGMQASASHPVSKSKAVVASPMPRQAKKSKLADGPSGSRGSSIASRMLGIPSLADILAAGILPSGAQQFLVGNVVTVDAVIGLDGVLSYNGQFYSCLSSFALAALKSRNPARKSCDGWKEVRWHGTKLEALRNQCHSITNQTVTA